MAFNHKSRGGRRWFVVESKAFELLIDEVGGKLRGCIWERCKGITSWIRFGDPSLSSLLAGVESCCRDRDDRSWSPVWEEEGRKMEGVIWRVEYFGRETERGWSSSLWRIKGPSFFEVLKKGKELEPRTFADVAKSKMGRLGDKVWLEVGMRVKPGRLEQLGNCLVGRWEKVETHPPKLDYLKNWAGHAWLLKGKLDIAVMGGGLLLFEFKLYSEAERVLARGKRKVLGSVLFLERWHPEVGCFRNGAFANEAWVRVVALPLHLWNHEVFKLIGDGCGGFIAVDNKTDSMAELQWARLLVKMMGRDLPTSVQIVDGLGCFSVQLWWETPPWFSQRRRVGEGCPAKGVCGSTPYGISSKGTTGFSSESAEKGPGVEVTDGEDSLGIRSQGARKVAREGGLGFGPEAFEFGADWEAQFSCGLGEASLKPASEGA
ncbi:hypothetical protein CK203_046365 [Vitis vinifera]|uniref:DUF4283 domain-containing protein n=1 Tax=Vitis vinifera TaxID=29760 RepID=A0A438FW50_VITVI|nr:hypothetical protein CK203_046365 [Vitis vinifera]